jgi:thiamine pyrophosphate-dependent acetolactate synthase large subunit-like protein
MREFTKLYLDNEIDRRSFMSRLAKIGLAAPAASGFARSVAAQTAASPPGSGRILTNMTGGELMAEFLLDWKVRYVFGLGGSEEVGFLDALVDRLALNYVQGIHEGAVMTMADGYSRASGDTPIMNFHSVAGTTYSMGQMVNAYKDGVPLVVTVGRQSTKIRGTNAFLESPNLHELPAEYTRWSWDVLNGATIPEVLRRAFVLAQVPMGGPTFLTFSKDMWEETVPRAEIIPRNRSTLDLDVAPNPDQVKRIADMLIEADYPVITVGRELARYGGADEVMELAELIGAPVFQDVYSSRMPMVYPSTHPHYSGMFDFDPDYGDDYDLFWSLGGRMFSLGAIPPKPVIARDVKVIHSGFDTSEIARNYPADLAVMANVRMTAAAVVDELKRRDLPSTKILDRTRRTERYHRERRERLDAKAQRRWDESPISSDRLTVELNRVLDPDAIIVSELVTSEFYLTHHLDIDHRRAARRTNLAGSAGVLGWGLGAAVGAKIAQPDRQVVALVGDGCVHFGPQSMWTASRYEVPVGFVVWNNGQYQANRRYLHNYGRRAAATGKYIGAFLGAPEIDNVSLAKAYGVEGERVEDPAKLSTALGRMRDVLAEGRAYLLDVKIAREFGGKQSTWYDFFSVAKKQSRQS